MGRLFLTEDEVEEQLTNFEHTAFRLELQRAYREPVEEAWFARFLAGDPQSPDEQPEFQEWLARMAALTATGRRVERVRVHDDPPTPYQQWERWTGAWNIRAGETMRYLDRRRAHEIGLLPAAGDEDWWLYDSCRLLVYRFDAEGNRLENELITDPRRVVQAAVWRDLAVHHAPVEVDTSSSVGVR
jgi:hypothetical protein